MDRYRVRFLPIDRTVYALKGESILDVAMQSGVYINGSCGGNGACGRCRVTVTSGEVSSSGGSPIPAEEYERGVRLACVSYPLGDITVEIPLESQIDRSALKRPQGGRHALAAARADGLVQGWSVDPPTVKKRVKLPPPSLEHNVSDAARLLVELKKQTKIEASLDFDSLEGLSRKLRGADWNVTVTLHCKGSGWTVQNIEEGDTGDKNYAVAVDIGTTTVCAQLIDITAP
ncbi:MAG TPA: ferredoxin, partial [Deltaproteobacteria bacterium]|nr:ferredoxin [Deltaproteobacteria bacterium]